MASKHSSFKRWYRRHTNTPVNLSSNDTHKLPEFKPLDLPVAASMGNASLSQSQTETDSVVNVPIAENQQHLSPTPDADNLHDSNCDESSSTQFNPLPDSFLRTFPFHPSNLTSAMSFGDEPDLDDFPGNRAESLPSQPHRSGFLHLSDLTQKPRIERSLSLLDDDEDFHLQPSDFHVYSALLIRPSEQLLHSLQVLRDKPPYPSLEMRSPMGTPFFPFYSPFGVHNVLPPKGKSKDGIPTHYASFYSLEHDPDNYTQTDLCCLHPPRRIKAYEKLHKILQCLDEETSMLVDHVAGQDPNLSGQSFGSQRTNYSALLSSLSITPNHNRSDLKTQHTPNDIQRIPILLFLVPPTIHLSPHLAEESDDNANRKDIDPKTHLFLHNMSPKLSMVITQGRRTLVQSVVPAAVPIDRFIRYLSSVLIEKDTVTDSYFNPNYWRWRVQSKAKNSLVKIGALPSLQALLEASGISTDIQPLSSIEQSRLALLTLIALIEPCLIQTSIHMSPERATERAFFAKTALSLLQLFIRHYTLKLASHLQDTASVHDSEKSQQFTIKQFLTDYSIAESQSLSFSTPWKSMFNTHLSQSMGMSSSLSIFMSSSIDMSKANQSHLTQWQTSQHAKRTTPYQHISSIPFLPQNDLLPPSQSPPENQKDIVIQSKETVLFDTSPLNTTTSTVKTDVLFSTTRIEKETASVPPEDHDTEADVAMDWAAIDDPPVEQTHIVSTDTTFESLDESAIGGGWASLSTTLPPSTSAGYLQVPSNEMNTSLASLASNVTQRMISQSLHLPRLDRAVEERMLEKDSIQKKQDGLYLFGHKIPQGMSSVARFLWDLQQMADNLKTSVPANDKSSNSLSHTPLPQSLLTALSEYELHELWRRRVSEKDRRISHSFSQIIEWVNTCLLEWCGETNQPENIPLPHDHDDKKTWFPLFALMFDEMLNLQYSHDDVQGLIDESTESPKEQVPPTNNSNDPKQPKKGDKYRLKSALFQSIEMFENCWDDFGRTLRLIWPSDQLVDHSKDPLLFSASSIPQTSLMPLPPLTISLTSHTMSPPVTLQQKSKEDAKLHKFVQSICCPWMKDTKPIKQLHQTPTPYMHPFEQNRHECPQSSSITETINHRCQCVNNTPLVPCNGHCQAIGVIQTENTSFLVKWHNHQRYLPTSSTITRPRTQYVTHPLDEELVYSKTFSPCIDLLISMNHPYHSFFDPHIPVHRPFWSHIFLPPAFQRTTIPEGTITTVIPPTLPLIPLPTTLDKLNSLDLASFKQSLSDFTNTLYPFVVSTQKGTPVPRYVWEFRNGHLRLVPDVNPPLEMSISGQAFSGSQFSAFVKLCTEFFALKENSDLFLERTLCCSPDTSKTGLPSGLFVVGDLHGNFNALLHVLSVVDPILEDPSSDHLIVFAGDYIDRGYFSFEVLVLLLLYRMKYPSKIVLLKGNHDSQYITEQRLSWPWRLFESFCHDNTFLKDQWTILLQLVAMFKKMPYSIKVTLTDSPSEKDATCCRRIFITHGGISASLPTLDIKPLLSDTKDYDSLEDMDNRNGPRNLRYEAAYSSIWNDPSDVDMPLEHRARFSEKATRRFMAANNLDLIVRGHEMAAIGTALMHTGQIVSVFSSYDYEAPYELSEVPGFYPYPPQLPRSQQSNKHILESLVSQLSSNEDYKQVTNPAAIVLISLEKEQMRYSDTGKLFAGFNNKNDTIQTGFDDSALLSIHKSTAQDTQTEITEWLSGVSSQLKKAESLTRKETEIKFPSPPRLFLKNIQTHPDTLLNSNSPTPSEDSPKNDIKQDLTPVLSVRAIRYGPITQLLSDERDFY
ncbi:putative Serine/threonine-protein phosphatase PP2A-3 catalytic subunit [Blattamonas nauphoetae]|uniref:Serine/threonine-protein phosphatase PP2A-3 catalytic subunit n=1 Tax=Blattamonas nauphoetae TaxID=2049346 RepID=A0ABQ9Y9L5_9EUKA|nr:putative Serine/threonine-protein phosphatase PP2A-3 catalytic subunit [Blattamonas nauphoetae]